MKSACATTNKVLSFYIETGLLKVTFLSDGNQKSPFYNPRYDNVIDLWWALHREDQVKTSEILADFHGYLALVVPYTFHRETLGKTMRS